METDSSTEAAERVEGLFLEQPIEKLLNPAVRTMAPRRRDGSFIFWNWMSLIKGWSLLAKMIHGRCKDNEAPFFLIVNLRQLIPVPPLLGNQPGGLQHGRVPGMGIPIRAR